MASNKNINGERGPVISFLKPFFWLHGGEVVHTFTIVKHGYTKTGNYTDILYRFSPVSCNFHLMNVMLHDLWIGGHATQTYTPVFLFAILVSIHFSSTQLYVAYVLHIYWSWAKAVCLGGSNNCCSTWLVWCWRYEMHGMCIFTMQISYCLWI